MDVMKHRRSFNGLPALRWSTATPLSRLQWSMAGAATGRRCCVGAQHVGVAAAMKYGRSCNWPPVLRWSTDGLAGVGAAEHGSGAMMKLDGGSKKCCGELHLFRSSTWCSFSSFC